MLCVPYIDPFKKHGIQISVCCCRGDLAALFSGKRAVNYQLVHPLHVVQIIYCHNSSRL